MHCQGQSWHLYLGLPIFLLHFVLPLAPTGQKVSVQGRHLGWEGSAPLFSSHPEAPAGPPFFQRSQEIGCGQPAQMPVLPAPHGMKMK